MDSIKAAKYVTKLQNIEDETTGEAFVKFRIKKTCNRTGHVIVQREHAGDANLLLTMFMRRNADLPSKSEEALSVITAAIKQSPLKYDLRVKHVGWQRGDMTFILGTKIIGDKGKRLKFAPPFWIDDHSARRLKMHGTLVGWQNKVAQPALWSSVLTLAILASFGAPLVKVSGLQNFAINIFGSSKVGKTTALLASTSFCGIGLERELPNWNSTSAAFMEEARGFNDLVLPGNEVGLIDGKKRDAYAVIRSRIYTFAEGRDRSRMSKASITTPKFSAMYRGIALYTSEFSFEQYAMLAGEERSPGEYARAIDVPAVRAGHTTIFDLYPKHVAKSEQAAWARQQLIALRRACENEYGTAIEPYVKHLMSIGKSLRRHVLSNIQAFLEKVAELDLDPALDHAARNFGLLYAAGCLGIEAEVLKWSRDHVMSVVLTCFKDAIRITGSRDNAFAEAKQELRRRLSMETIRSDSTRKEFGPEDAPGFRRTVSGMTEYVVHSAAFRQWFGGPVLAAAVLRWLHEEGLLSIQSKNVKSSATATEWAERGPRWPDGTTQKSFIFRDPFPKKTSARAG